MCEKLSISSTAIPLCPSVYHCRYQRWYHGRHDGELPLFRAKGANRFCWHCTLVHWPYFHKSMGIILNTSRLLFDKKRNILTLDSKKSRSRDTYICIMPQWLRHFARNYNKTVSAYLITPPSAIWWQLLVDMLSRLNNVTLCLKSLWLSDIMRCHRSR